jgi:hypothetical protein
MPRFLKRQVLLMWVIIHEKNRIYRNNILHVTRRVCWCLCAHFASWSCQLTDQGQQKGKYQQELPSRHLDLEKEARIPTASAIQSTHTHTHTNARAPQAKICTIIARGAKIFQKSKSHPKCLGAKKVIRREFHNGDPQIFGSNFKKIWSP